MGGCASRPKELDGPNQDAVPVEKPVESEVTKQPVEGDASVQKGETESATEPENKEESEPDSKEEPLVDLSEPKPKAEKTEVVELAPEISELTTDTPMEDVPVTEQVTEAEKKEEAIEEKAEEVRESEEKVSS